MIYVHPQPEPENFENTVRKPGKKFLQKTSHPINWKHHEYWQKSLPDLYRVYGGICAYSAHWIPRSLTDPTVDHFIPKSNRPELAYEWDNFRLSCGRLNRLKLNYEDVLDPFTIGADWFWMHFPSLQLQPNKQLEHQDKSRIWATIARLQLNGSVAIEGREVWIKDYHDRQISFEFLKRNAPLIAREIERQGLIEKIHEVMRYR